MEYKAKYTNNDATCCLGTYSDLEDAIDACCQVGYGEEEDFDEEEEMCRDSLKSRGYYCIGYSTLCLEIETIP